MELIYVIMILGIYFIPALVALGNEHKQSVPICALNLLLGWTFIFWVVALCWALMNQENKEEVR